MRYIIPLLTLVCIATQLAAILPGEKLTFKVKYGAITAGEATMQVREETYDDTVAVYRITTNARTTSFFDTFYKVRDEVESIWRKRDRVSLKFTKNLSEGSYRQLRVHNYYPDLNFTVYSKYSFSRGTFSDKTMDIPEGTQDILTALFMVRDMELTVGESVYIPVVTDGDTFNTEVKICKRERVNTIFGKIDCIVVEPILQGEAIFKQTGRILVWMTDDEHHIPVKLQSKIIYGSFYGILVDAKNVPLEVKD